MDPQPTPSRTERFPALVRALARLGLLLALPVCRADTQLAKVFADHMVLQRDLPLPVWGWTAPGDTVTVSLGSASATAVADTDGKWLAWLPRQEAGGPTTLSAEARGNAVTVRDVLIGEVWLCSGQSNMQWPVRSALNATGEMQAAVFAGIRLLAVWPTRECEAPVANLGSAGWKVCGPDTIGSFSAVAYFFGRHLHRELGVPVGLINASYGGTPIEAWCSREALLADEGTAVSVKEWEKAKLNIATIEKEYEAKTKEWKTVAAQAKAEGREAPPPPRETRFARAEKRPGALFNTTIHPLIPTAARGVIWYQGEAGGQPYDLLLPALIKDWRGRWGKPAWPFCIGQLHNVGPPQTDPNENHPWARMREIQFHVSRALANVGLTVSIDLGIPDDTHYPNKQEVGRRMALWALAEVYGRDLVWSGPVFESMQVESSRIRLRFEHVADGLTARGDPLNGFVVAGADRRCHWAQAAIEGDTVVVSCPEVAQPVAVRYGWAWNPPCNLYNRAGLPAVPFRTDNW